MWFVAFCVGVRAGMALEPSTGWHKFHTGQVFQGDSERIATLELVAIAQSGDPLVIGDPKRVIGIANGFSAAGMPTLIEYLRQPNMKPLDGFADAMKAIGDIVVE
jgi:hypothetical protein